MEKVAYLGPEGSYSQLAAIKLRPEAEHIAYGSFRLVVDALERGECNLAVLPIENSLNGSVIANIDLLQSTEDIFTVEKTGLTLDHRLATLTGADIKGITRVFSHEQALAQCEKYLYKNFPQAELIAAPSTMASLNALETTSDAAIVGAHVKREGITLSKDNIADFTNNVTDFLLVKKGGAEKNKKSDRIFFSVACVHSAGALYDVLQPLRDGGVNMTKIQSRPIRGSAGEYRFFIEVEGDLSSEKVRKVLDEVKSISLSFKLLGAYFSDDNKKD
ncbi:MAG: hypothetical protein K2K80_07120 [Clostridia bacterium]|nr:hypothetical protein [Clostridia bacterium]